MGAWPASQLGLLHEDRTFAGPLAEAHNSHTRQRELDSWEPEAKGVTLGLAANYKVIDALALKHTLLSPCALQACGRNSRVGPECDSGPACSM